MQLEHMLQIVLYKWSWNQTFLNWSGARNFKLLNVLTGECLLVNGSHEQISDIANMLIREKYVDNHLLTDEEFVAENYRAAVLIQNE